MAKSKIIAIHVPVEISAAAPPEEGEAAGPPKFDVVAYNGGALNVNFWDLPVVIDIAGLQFARSIVANLSHSQSQMVGHVTESQKADNKIHLSGVFSLDTPETAMIVNGSKNGFPWEASVEVQPTKVVEVAAGKKVKVNGQEFTGPLYVTRKGLLSGFAFVSHGADPNTEVKIAASATDQKEHAMKEEVKVWATQMLPSLDVDSLSADEVTNLEAQYAGIQAAVRPPKKKDKLEDELTKRQDEVDRVDAISEIAINACDKRPYDINAIKKLAQDAIDAKWTVEKFRLELLEASLPPSGTVFSPRRGENRITDRVLEAAICSHGRLPDIDKHYSDQELQIAHDKFRGGIGLKEVIVIAAQSFGHHQSGFSITQECHNAAFGLNGHRGISAQGFSTLSLPNTFANVANKFMRVGWMSVDQTLLEIASIRSVRDFKQITTISLTGGLEFLPVGPDGEIKHGQLGEEVYNNKADTYGLMLALTRTDYINDDLGVLTTVPRRLGRGGMLKLNTIGWTEFLDNASFFTSGNANVNEGVANMTIGGLSATELVFMDQTDPDGKPMAIQPAILLVPTALKAAAMTLMASERVIDGTSTALQGDANIYRGRFKVVSNAYLGNSAISGSSDQAWYMLADPADIPVLEIAALNGRVEPIIETADAAFNVLGVQMRGYNDVGVSKQEFRGGVRADGGSS